MCHSGLLGNVKVSELFVTEERLVAYTVIVVRVVVSFNITV